MGRAGPFAGRGAWLAVVAVAVLGGCPDHVTARMPFDVATGGYRVTQTFGQLIEHRGMTVPAPFVKLALPPGTWIHAPVTGVLQHHEQFEGLGPALLLRPKLDGSGSNYGSLKGLGEPKDVWFVFAHLVAADVRSAVESRYAIALRKSDVTEETDRFLRGDAGNRDLDVKAAADLADSTRIGRAEADELVLAAFRGDPATQ